MRIALDAMGSDRAPVPEVAGALEAVATSTQPFEIVLVGDRSVVEAELARQGHSAGAGGITVRHAPERVDSSDPPSMVARRKPDSSIPMGLRMHKEGEVDAFVSAGSTGAVMASSLFVLRPVAGVERPPAGAHLPTAGEMCLLLDAGANVGCKPRHLVQFARLGTVYVRRALGRHMPRVGLVNIGQEPTKGDELTLAAHRALAMEPGINFIGNIEGSDIVQGRCDVAVCDGFVGNVLLKFYESVAAYIVSLLNEELASHDATGVDLSGALRVLDYAEYGGAPLLGLNGISIICHGASSPKAIRNAIHFAAASARSDLVRHTVEDLHA